MPSKIDTIIPSTPQSNHMTKPGANISLLEKGCAWFTLPWLVASLLFMAKIYRPGFGDPDFYWHLKSGEYIAQTGVIPTSDPFSWTFLGKPWVAHEWLTEVVFHGLMRLGGFAAISLLVAILSVATFAQIYRLASRLSGSEMKGAVIASICAILILPFLVPRPQLFTFFFFVVYLDVLLDLKLSGSAKRLWLLPILMLLWVNLHGAFMIGLALLFSFIFLEWVEYRISGSLSPARSHKLRLLGLILALTVLATLVNPQGARIWLFPFELVSLEVSKGGIEEWKSPDFHQAWGKLYLVGIGAFITCIVYTKIRPGITEIVLAIAMLAAGLTSSRHLPLTALLLGALSAIYVRAIELPAGLSAWLDRRRKVAKEKKQDVTPTVAGLINLAALAAIFALLQTGLVPTAPKPALEEQVPIGAVDYLQANHVTGRMFNSYGLGGYLIYRLSPEQKVFIDGRADMYGDEFLDNYRKIEHGQEVWREVIDKYPVDFAVIYRKSALRQLLVEEGSFKEVYKDEHHVILLKDQPKFRALIEEAKSKATSANSAKELTR